MKLTYVDWSPIMSVTITKTEPILDSRRKRRAAGFAQQLRGASFLINDSAGCTIDTNGPPDPIWLFRPSFIYKPNVRAYAFPSERMVALLSVLDRIQIACSGYRHTETHAIFGADEILAGDRVELRSILTMSIVRNDVIEKSFFPWSW
jgi:hypothetical protein